jgi:tRNA-2-methylthio-N6-dimethylallyladenosine synthase
MQLVHDVGYDSSFSFIFSPRPGTPAAALHDETPHEVKLARLQQLQAALDASVTAISASRLGTVQRVLVEGAARKTPNALFGRTDCNRAVVLEGPDRLIGQMVDVLITDAPQRSLRGEVVLRDEAPASS